ncbi:MAG: alkaline shock response membrane anchor protein AmaP [Clostridia bacterium]|nr:alkaline shock response membrane anchor protein AmaP [Clostridia bacterium]
MTAGDRVLLGVCLAVFGVASAGTLAFALGWDEPLRAAGYVATNAKARWELALASAVALALDLRLLAVAGRSPARPRAVVHENEMGTVRVSLHAIAALVTRIARQVRGVRDVRVDVTATEGGVVARLRVWVAPDANIPALSTALQDEVARSVRSVVGVDVARVSVLVEDLVEGRRARVE